jgi:SAM-dependent methyltransferase/NAD(P)-dependent dehydrogenase (short-subunit alcohol dehydrogenase family)/acyl carrier protein
MENVDRRLPKSPASEPPANWFYQLCWQPKPALSYMGPSGNADAADFQLLKATGEQLSIETGFSDYHILQPALDSICTAFIVRAFRRLGYTFSPGTEVHAGDLARTLGVAAQHLPLFDRLLAILSEAGIVGGDGRRRVILRNPAAEEPDIECRSLESQFAPFRAEIEMLRRCGDALAEVLSGRTDPLQLLFSEGSFESAEQLYTESPGLRVFNNLAAHAIAEEARRRPGRKLRILEIGAGTGATTNWIAEVLPPERTEYCYTDISAAFLSRAKVRFKHYSFFQYRTLDIERDPRSQGFESGQFDIIIASNVLHATIDLRSTMNNVRRLLAPSGIVLLVEGIRPERWVDLTFGLTEGWWRFRDYDLRPSYPLLAQTSWMDLLSKTGFCGAGSVRPVDSQVAIILARAPHTEVAQHWLVIPDDGNMAAEFTFLLEGLGGKVTMARSENSTALLQSQRFDGVLYLSALDCPKSDELSSDSLVDMTVGKGTEILHLAQGVIKLGGKLWMVTRGAQQVVGGETGLNVAQAPVWGWAKTISLEHPNCGGGVIDLDPSAPDRESAAAILDAIAGDGLDNEDQSAIRNGARYVPRLQRAVPPAPHTQPLSKDKIYLITGGLGGLGLRLARWMAQRGARRLLLVGRTTLTDRATWDNASTDPVIGEKIAAIREIENFGAEVTLRAVDICDHRQIVEMFAALPGELGGILHLAAAGEMSSLASMTSAGMRDAMAPKTLGTWNLHEASKDLAIDFFIMFSSWASVLGAQVLGHYNAANQFIDAVAHYRKSLGLPVASVNWGAWDVIRNASDELRGEYERSGLRSMPSDVAFTAMYRAATAGTTQTIVADVDWRLLKALYEVRRPRPILESVDNLVPGSIPSPANREEVLEEGLDELPKSIESRPVSIRTDVLALPTGERVRFLLPYLTSVLASVIGTPNEQLPCETATDELGLDSLMALEARNRINSDLEINIPAVRFLQGFTITQLAAKIAAELPEGTANPPEDDAPTPAEPSNPVDESFALSFAQRAQWIVQRVVPNSYTLNCGFTAKASPPLQFAVFERSVWKLMERHAALRTVVFETDEGNPRQRVLKTWRTETTLIDAGGLSEPELADVVTREFQRAFDVRKSVFRILVFRRVDCDIALFVFHHLVVDGTSAPLCFAELRDIYTAELAGRPLQLAPPKASYREFVEWETELVNGPGFQRLWEYWKNELSGDLPVLSLPFSRPRPVAFLPRGERIDLEFDRDFARAIHDAAKKSKSTTFSFLLAAFQILLCSYSGQDDLLVGTSSSSRDMAKWDNTVGCLVNLFPVRSRLSRDETFAERLANVRETMLNALDHQGLPFPLLVERLRIRRDLGCPPLFQAFFNYLTDRPGNFGRFLLGIENTAVQFGDSVLKPWIGIKHYEVQSDVLMYLADLGDEIYACMSYNADVVDESVAQSMAADYLSIIRAVVVNPNIPISQLPITSFVQPETANEELLF